MSIHIKGNGELFDDSLDVGVGLPLEGGGSGVDVISNIGAFAVCDGEGDFRLLLIAALGAGKGCDSGGIAVIVVSGPDPFRTSIAVAFRRNNPTVLCNLVLAAGIAEVLAATRAGVILTVARRRAGRCLCVMVYQIVAQRCDHPAVGPDLVLAVCVAEVLTAHRAGVILAVARRRAGRCLCVMVYQIVAQRCDHPAVGPDLVLAVCVAEVLAAHGAGPVGAVTGLSAGSVMSLGRGQGMSHIRLGFAGGVDSELITVVAGEVADAAPAPQATCERVRSVASDIDRI